jgi:pyruvate/2-oxoglutarate dehydrogenase complex dihydrolipoamide acyltransferase (E2) component
MRLTATALMPALLLASGPAWAENHLVSQAAADARLAAAAQAGSAERAALGRVLATPAAERTAARLGVDIRDVRAAAATLTDAETRDLARRATALRTDPAAGLSHDVDHLLVVFLIVAIVVLVLKAV